MGLVAATGEGKSRGLLHTQVFAYAIYIPPLCWTFSTEDYKSGSCKGMKETRIHSKMKLVPRMLPKDLGNGSLWRDPVYEISDFHRCT